MNSIFTLKCSSANSDAWSTSFRRQLTCKRVWGWDSELAFIPIHPFSKPHREPSGQQCCWSGQQVAYNNNDLDNRTHLTMAEMRYHTVMQWTGWSTSMRLWSGKHLKI